MDETRPDIATPVGRMKELRNRKEREKRAIAREKQALAEFTAPQSVPVRPNLKGLVARTPTFSDPEKAIAWAEALVQRAVKDSSMAKLVLDRIDPVIAASEVSMTHKIEIIPLTAAVSLPPALALPDGAEAED